MAGIDEDFLPGPAKKKPVAHEIGQHLDDLSAPELSERIAALRQEILRLESAIAAREKTRQAASAFFKS